MKDCAAYNFWWTVTPLVALRQPFIDGFLASDYGWTV